MKYFLALNFLILLMLGVFLLSCGFKAKPVSDELDYRPDIPFRGQPAALQEKDNEQNDDEALPSGQ
jgi:hypothetical protein